MTPQMTMFLLAALLSYHVWLLPKRFRSIEVTNRAVLAGFLLSMLIVISALPKLEGRVLDALLTFSFIFGILPMLAVHAGMADGKFPMRAYEPYLRKR